MVNGVMRTVWVVQGLPEETRARVNRISSFNTGDARFIHHVCTYDLAMIKAETNAIIPS